MKNVATPDVSKLLCLYKPMPGQKDGSPQVCHNISSTDWYLTKFHLSSSNEGNNPDCILNLDYTSQAN